MRVKGDMRHKREKGAFYLFLETLFVLISIFSYNIQTFSLLPPRRRLLSLPERTREQRVRVNDKNEKFSCFRFPLHAFLQKSTNEISLFLIIFRFSVDA